MINLKLIHDNTIEITGIINFNNVIDVLEKCISKTANIKHITVNLKNLEDSNSCVLIFMINYMRHSIKHKQKIRFINIPPLLNELSKVYNLNNIINNE